QLAEIARMAGERLGFQPGEIEEGVPLEAVELPAPRVGIPQALAGVVTDDPIERASHTYGKAYRDLVRAFRGRYDNPPDLVARPRDEADIERVLEWAAAARVAVIPYGGGTSVVGGVEARLDGDYAGALSLDLRALDRILEVDQTSQAA